MTVPAILAEVLLELEPALRALEAAELGDAWLAAGVIRNRVWSRRFRTPCPETDWDVAFLGELTDEEACARLERALRGPWEAVNQARYGHRTTSDALASWPETATAIGARLRAGQVEVLAPWGFEDLVDGCIRRPPSFSDTEAYHRRRERLLSRWPALTEPTQRPSRVEPAIVVLPR